MPGYPLNSRGSSGGVLCLLRRFPNRWIRALRITVTDDDIKAMIFNERKKDDPTCQMHVRF